MMCGYAMCLIERIGRKTCRPAPSWVKAFAKIVLFRLLTFFFYSTFRNLLGQETCMCPMLESCLQVNNH